MTRDEMLEVLRDSVTNVEFTKKDGSNRVMRCTLNADMLPKRIVNEVLDGPAPAPENLEIIKVYDLDADGWRSFRVDSVKNFAKA